MKALGLHHAALGSADLDGQIAYFEETIGLKVVERTSQGVYLAARSGSDSLLLSRAANTSLVGFALLVGADADPAELLTELTVAGINAELRSDPHPGIGRGIGFVDPDGFEVEVLFGSCLWPASQPRGAAPLRLGHLALAVRDVTRTARFYESMLGFSIGDWIGGHFVFMRCGHEHHTLNFIQSDTSRMQHIAFEMPDAAALTASCDVLGQAGLRLLWGPVRHGPGHNIATYHLNPQGQIVELYAGMDLMTNEALGYYDPRPWHADRPQRPKVWTPVDLQRDIWGLAGPADFLKLGR